VRQGGSTQTVVAASAVAGGAVSEVDGTSSVIRPSPHNEHDKRSMEMDDPQGPRQATPVVNVCLFGEAPLSIAECSPEIYRVIACENQKNSFD
jgi:hypothetical protein